MTKATVSPLQEFRDCLRGLLTYVEDGNVVELRPCGFIRELVEQINALEKRIGRQTPADVSAQDLRAKFQPQLRQLDEQIASLRRLLDGEYVDTGVADLLQAALRDYLEAVHDTTSDKEARALTGRIEAQLNDLLKRLLTELAGPADATRHFRGSLLASENESTCLLQEGKHGRLQVVAVEALQAYSLRYCLRQEGEQSVWLDIAQHPNGHSCRELADRILAAWNDPQQRERALQQFYYILSCGGLAMSAVAFSNLIGLSEPDQVAK